MASITNQILAAVVLELSAAGLPQGVNVERSRRRPSGMEDLPLITVRPSHESVVKTHENLKCPLVERTLDIAVTVRCQGTDEDLDPYRSWVVAAVMRDLSLGGLAIEVTENDHDWDSEDASDADYAEDEIIFSVRYRTSRASVDRST